MCSFGAESCERPWEEPTPGEVEAEDQPGDWDERSHLESEAVPDDVWDAFELDEETAEPQPEYGDFWGELDEDEGC